MPNGNTDHLDLINRDEYESTLAANPSLECHPQFLQPGQQSRDFVSSEDGPPQSSQSLQTEEQGFQDSLGQPGRRLTTNLQRCESIPQYAHGGDEDHVDSRREKGLARGPTLVVSDIKSKQIDTLSSFTEDHPEEITVCSCTV